MKILYVAYTPLCKHGAAPVHVGAIAGGLAKRGHSLTLIAPELAKPFALDGVEVVFLQSRLEKAAIWARSAAEWIGASAREFDLLYLRDFYFANPVLKAAEGIGLPVVLESNGSAKEETKAENLRNRSIALLDWYLYQKARLRAADQVVAVSPELAKALSALDEDKAKFHFLPNGVDLDLYNDKADKSLLRAELGLPVEGILIGNVGSIFPYHIESPIVQVVEGLASRFPDLRFLHVGGGPAEEAFKQKISASKKPDRFIIKGRVSPEQSAKFVQALDVAVTWTTREAGIYCWPVRLSAFAASGIPIVAPDWGVYGFFAERGALIPAHGGTAGNMIEAVETLLKDKNLHQITSENGRKLAESELSWDSIVEKIETILNEAINSKRRKNG